MAWCTGCNARTPRRALRNGRCPACATPADRGPPPAPILTLPQQIDRLNALPWGRRVFQGVVWGVGDALARVFILAWFIDWLLRRTRPNRESSPPPLPRSPGWTWLVLWIMLTLVAVGLVFRSGVLAIVGAILATTFLIGAAHGGYQAARGNWDWWFAPAMAHD